MSTPPPEPLPPSRPLGERLLIATLFLAAGDLAGKVLAFFITVIRTRTLTQAEFGGFGFIVQTIGMFAQVAGFSLGLAATRYVALYRLRAPAKSREVAQFITLFGLGTTLVAAGVMIVTASQLVRELPGLETPLRWSVLILVTQTLSGLFLGFLAGLERFRAATLAVLLQNVVMLGLTFWWAPAWGLLGTLLAMAAGFAVTLLVALIQTRDLVGGRWASPRAIWSHRHIVLEFCLPTLLGGMIIVPASWLATLIIARQHGDPAAYAYGMLVIPPMTLTALGLTVQYASGLTQVALFTAADQFRPLLSMLANVVAQPMMPLVAQQIHLAEDSTAEVGQRREAHRLAQRATERSFQLGACLILPSHAFLAFAAPYVMAIFGRSFASDWNIFLVVLLWGAMAGLSALIGVALNALGKVWYQNTFLGVYGLILVSMTYVLQTWGAYGLALANLVASLTTILLGGIILYRAGFFPLRALGILTGAFGWMTTVTLASAFTPAPWRIAGIVVAVGVTFLVLASLQRSEMEYVWNLIRRRFGRPVTLP